MITGPCLRMAARPVCQLERGLPAGCRQSARRGEQAPLISGSTHTEQTSPQRRAAFRAVGRCGVATADSPATDADTVVIGEIPVGKTEGLVREWFARHQAQKGVSYAQLTTRT
jgi:hypothetical protein